ncbi:hypothetical protein [Lichenibacterium dinghuense]|uniref:hypothetical protein n=1 Tax=Lichenibacterium dinghuense TaxID=2895977 RepID=UPI001F171D61|nr:hypothetical protein [Lichenibacterium sp. 6Y81]
MDEVDGHEKGQVFKALMREASAACPDLDVSDLPWRWLAIAAARRLCADPPSDRAAEVWALLIDAPVRQAARA